jgi:mannose-1-phosphate guanylyltransferase
MILAAGKGLRMRPLSLLRAKPVLPVLNRPLIHWTLDRLAAAGVTEVVINLHHRPETVRSCAGTGRRFGLRIRYSHERRILGTGGGPRRVRDVFGGEAFLLVNGDILFDGDLAALVRSHRRSGARATLALRPNPDPARYSPVVTGPGGWIRSIAGRPRRARGPVSLFAGIHVLDPSLLDRLPPGVSDTVRHLYLGLVDEPRGLRGVRLRGAWYDFGSPALYLASHRALVAARGGRGRRGLVHPSARIERGARVEGSVVGERARIRAGATVTGSVLWERAVVEPGAVVAESILAAGVRAHRGETLRGVTVVPASAARGAGAPGRRSRGRLVCPI